MPLPAEYDASESAIRFLEERVNRYPLDFMAHNKLAGYYLQRQRETGNMTYLELASRAARASLAVVPTAHNVGALSALTQVAYASHDFAAARDYALQLAQRDPGKSYPYELLGDALLELGDYDSATHAYRKVQEPGMSMSGETRQARLALLRGQPDLATLHYANAVILALELRLPSREAVAWCRWQLGETAFSIGDYETAERHYRDALITFPDYYRALASLGRVLEARGNRADAIVQYERVTRILPDPAFVAALGDLYRLAGRAREAAAQYALVEHIARLSAFTGTLYNRQLALFYADHDMKAEDAHAGAVKEYETRRDIYGADAVAWTALKAGRIATAQAAMQEALRLGTRDAKLYYHAGMIAQAAGEKAAARDYLQRALQLNPQFDPLQAAVARKALEQ
jgi:tetratricopeptide (TPR) repeat protein